MKHRPTEKTTICGVVWATDFYTPPVLGGAALCRFQRQQCIKILCPKDPDFYTPLALKTAKGQHLPALEVYKNQSPIVGANVMMTVALVLVCALSFKGTAHLDLLLPS